MERNITNLAVSHRKASVMITSQIKRGIEIKDTPIHTKEDLSDAQAKLLEWNDYNTEMLKRVFDTSEISKDYAIVIPEVAYEEPIFKEETDDFRLDVQDRIDRLQSIKGKLQLYAEPTGTTGSRREEAKALLSNKVFIVHGHDEAAKQSVAWLLEKLDLDPIILHEQPNKGRTIIEKFEEYSDVGYAVVLLTADDEGKSISDKEDSKPKHRARQNVIFELGFFIGTLGREKVCPLYQEGVELPSDYDGVVYTPLDESGAWRLKLAQELDTVYDIDFNKLKESS